MRTKILLPIFTLLLLSMTARAQSLNVDFRYPQQPSVSRFQGFTGTIPADTAPALKLDSIKIFINGKDESDRLKMEQQTDSGEVNFSFQPADPLPVGKVEVQFLAYTVQGPIYSQRFSYTIDPSSDPDFGKIVQALQENPTDAGAHYQLGQLYEQKRLFQDAAYEYSRAAYFDPGDSAAKSAYDRIFAMWGEKSLEKDQVLVDARFDDALLSMGGPVAIEVRVTNEGSDPITVDPKAAVLVDGEGHQVFALDDLNAYIDSEADDRLVSMEQYAQISYFIDSHPMEPLGPVTLHSTASASGYVVFPRPEGDVRRFTFIFAKIAVNGKDLDFTFPFVLP